MPAGTVVNTGSLVAPGGAQGIPGPQGIGPTGSVMDFAGSTAPSGWLLCDGTSYPTSLYPNLYAVIGYTYGGSGANFNVPNCLGRATIGAGAGAGLTNRALGANGGEENHQLVAAELASHPHLMADHWHGMEHYHTFDVVNNCAAGTNWGPTGNNAGTTKLTTSYAGQANGSWQTTRALSDTGNYSSGVGNTGSAGSDTPHNTMMPFIAFNKIIKT